MGQQALDLRSSIKAVRRHKKIFFAIVALGLLVGAAYAVVKPPQFSSTSLVLLPSIATSQNAQGTVAGSTDDEIATQVVIASSSPVLSNALPDINPAVSLQTLEGRIQVQSLAGSIVSISATGTTAAQAEATANAVAASYATYISSADSPTGRMPARVLQPATTATGGKFLEQVAVYGLLGLLGGAIVGFIILLAISTSDRRLVERDAIANSIGAPVLAALPVGRPTDAASWAKLFESYEPGVVHAWALTRMLRQFGLSASEQGTSAHPSGGFSLTVLSLASDPAALALGPQLAAFAAASGISTALIVGPQQDVNVTATLRTACATLQSQGDQRKPLQFIAPEDEHLDAATDDQAGQPSATLEVVVAVVDGRTPQVPHTVPTTATVLGVTAGAATAEQLARAAVAAAADGREVVGILVANPDPADQSTGRLPRLTPPLRRQLPTRLNDAPTEIKR